jgi:hypothetical protein
MVVVAIVEPAQRASFQEAFRATAKERGFQDHGWMRRYGVLRDCAEHMVAERRDGVKNGEHEWACIVPGDPTQHADEVKD